MKIAGCYPTLAHQTWDRFDGGWVAQQEALTATLIRLRALFSDEDGNSRRVLEVQTVCHPKARRFIFAPPRSLWAKRDRNASALKCDVQTTPAINLNNAGCVNCSRANSPTRRPPRNTRIRRLRAITSGSSLETTNSPNPCTANSSRS